MIFYEWNEKLSVNNSKIDNEHKRIIDKARELSRYMLEGEGKEVLFETLDFLNEYVKTHFSNEEDLQFEYNYPRIKEHQAAHNDFVKELEELTYKIKEDPEAHTNTLELNTLITGWFFKHIMGLDKDLAEYIKNH